MSSSSSVSYSGQGELRVSTLNIRTRLAFRLLAIEIGSYDLFDLVQVPYRWLEWALLIHPIQS